VERRWAVMAAVLALALLLAMGVLGSIVALDRTEGSSPILRAWAVGSPLIPSAILLAVLMMFRSVERESGP
jgi:hypothetical protein